MQRVRPVSSDEHAVAVTEEAIALTDRMGVRCENSFAAAFCTGERADQHQQAGLRQMEIGEHGVDDSERITGGQEDGGFAGMGLELAVGSCGSLRAVLHCADGGGAYGYDATAIAAGAVEGVCCLWGQRVALAMQVNLVDALDSQRSESAEAYVECELGYFNAAGFDLIEDGGREVKACCGCGDGAALSGEDGLIALAIGGCVVSLDVRGKRHVADLFEGGEEVFDGGEAESAFAEYPAACDFRFKQDRA